MTERLTLDPTWTTGTLIDWLNETADACEGDANSDADNLRVVASRLLTLSNERDEAQKDGERLDWLERQAREAFANPTEISDLDIGIAGADFPDCKKGVSVVLTHGYADETIGDTLRAVIDAAREGR